MDSATDRPFSSWMSAITTFAPCSAKRRAVASPIPLAPPVMMAILLSNFLVNGGIALSIFLQTLDSILKDSGWESSTDMCRDNAASSETKSKDCIFVLPL